MKKSLYLGTICGWKGCKLLLETYGGVLNASLYGEKGQLLLVLSQDDIMQEREDIIHLKKTRWTSAVLSRMMDRKIIKGWFPTPKGPVCVLNNTAAEPVMSVVMPQMQRRAAAV